MRAKGIRNTDSFYNKNNEYVLSLLLFADAVFYILMRSHKTRCSIFTQFSVHTTGTQGNKVHDDLVVVNRKTSISYSIVSITGPFLLWANWFTNEKISLLSESGSFTEILLY